MPLSRKGKIYDKNPPQKFPKYLDIRFSTPPNVASLILIHGLIPSHFCAHLIVRLARFDGRSSVLAVVGGTLRDRLGLVAGCGSLELLTDSLDGRSAGGRDGSGTAKVRVDTSEDLSVVGLDVLDDNGTGDRVLAVTAGAVELAEVL